MQHDPPQEYRPRARLISVVANTAIFSLLLAAFTLWHVRELDTLQTSYLNRIEALHSEIRALKATGTLDTKSAELIEQMFSQIRAIKRESQVKELLGLLLIGVGVAAVLLTIVASVVVLRNRKAVETAFRSGFVEGAYTGLQKAQAIPNLSVQPLPQETNTRTDPEPPVRTPRSQETNERSGPTSPVRTPRSAGTAFRQRAADLRAKLDALEDQIDTVLEETTEEFVKNYVQRGGE